MQSGGDTYVLSTGDALSPELDGPTQVDALPQALVGIMSVRGYRTSATIVLSGALGWCMRGRHSVVQTEYISDLTDPQPPAAVSTARALADGCAPASTASYREPGHLVMYRATTVDAETPSAVTLMFERGNVRSLSSTDMSLFSIPADFTKE